MTELGATWQKEATLVHTSGATGTELRHTIMSGDRPSARNSRTDACMGEGSSDRLCESSTTTTPPGCHVLTWVGLVFCSPTAPTTGTRDT